MTTYFTNFCPASPLTDCTNSIDNAENISSNSKLSLNKIQKPYPSTAAVVQHVKYILDSAIVDAQVRRETRAPSVCSNHLPLSSTKSPASSPVRHDPYSPCLVASSMTAYDSFIACYADAQSEETNEPTKAAPNACAVPAPRSASIVTAPPPPRQTSVSLSSTPEKAPTSLQLSQDGGVSSMNTSILSSAGGSPARHINTATTTTVVKTFVRCAVDRTSGRPIPVRKQRA